MSGVRTLTYLFLWGHNSPCNTSRPSCCPSTLANYSLVSQSYLHFFELSTFFHLHTCTCAGPSARNAPLHLFSSAWATFNYLLKLKGHFLFSVNLLLHPIFSQNKLLGFQCFPKSLCHILSVTFSKANHDKLLTGLLFPVDCKLCEDRDHTFLFLHALYLLHSGYPTT